ncbi:MAG: hypothetical protein LBP95_06855 [Deltaproteobacteria bacterium]|jgi:hypothetical protein|nr:hypothetical protein [Deltaproteobacteria bacterium]
MADDKLTDEKLAAEAPGAPAGLSEGIYLETKKNIIGTGSTAKVAEYRNFWATLKVGGQVVEMVLLDDAFGLTGIREKFPVEVVSGSNWLYVEQGEKKYRQLRQKLDNLLAPPKPAAPRSPLGSSGSKGGAGASKKTGWWSK